MQLKKLLSYPKANELVVATAESCTAGLIAGRLARYGAPLEQPTYHPGSVGRTARVCRKRRAEGGSDAHVAHLDHVRIVGVLHQQSPHAVLPRGAKGGRLLVARLAVQAAAHPQ